MNAFARLPECVSLVVNTNSSHYWHSSSRCFFFIHINIHCSIRPFFLGNRQQWSKKKVLLSSLKPRWLVWLQKYGSNCFLKYGFVSRKNCFPCMRFLIMHGLLSCQSQDERGARQILTTSDKKYPILANYNNNIIINAHFELIISLWMAAVYRKIQKHITSMISLEKDNIFVSSWILDNKISIYFWILVS